MVAGCTSDKVTDEVPENTTIKEHVITFDGPEWSQFVAKQSYSGDVMTETYIWEDPATTLTSRPIFPDTGYGKYYGGGATVSNFGSDDLENKGSYLYDLYAYFEGKEDNTTGAGSSGSDNFLVLFSNYEEGSNDVDCRPTIYFSDGKPRQILDCEINATTYFVNIVENGNAFSPKLNEGDKVEVIARGFDADGKQTGEVRYTLAEYGSTTKSWQRWTLGDLGEVVKVQFTMVGGPSTEWGMTTPRYFALDSFMVVEKQ